MQAFSFDSVPTIRCEWGASARLGALLAARFAERRALLVTDAFLRETGLIAPALASLEAAGFTVRIFDAVTPDPPESVLAACVAGAEGCDIVVGLGGGSSLDVAKLAAVLLRSRQPLAEMYGIDKVEGDRAPLVLVPTTAGTGSEVTNISVITTGATTKAGVVSRQLFADFALLDAELTLALPPLHTAATGIDAMVHAIEAYTGRHRKNPVSDAFAREALRLLHANLLTACRDGANREAREGMLLGAALAGQAFANSPVAAVHALAYPIGGRHKVPHGLSNALMLGPVLRFNLPVAAALYAELSDVIGLAGGGSHEARAHLFVDTMARLLHATGAPARLREVGIERRDLPLLAQDALMQQRLLMNNPRDIQEADALELYEEAY